MSRSSDETRIDQARVARDEARALFRADMAVLRESLAERPLTQRLRDRVVHAAADGDPVHDQRALVDATPHQALDRHSTELPIE